MLAKKSTNKLSYCFAVYISFDIQIKYFKKEKKNQLNLVEI